MQVTCKPVDGRIAQTDVLGTETLAEIKVNIEAAKPELGISVDMVTSLLTALSGAMAGAKPGDACGCLITPPHTPHQAEPAATASPAAPAAVEAPLARGGLFEMN